MHARTQSKPSTRSPGRSRPAPSDGSVGGRISRVTSDAVAWGQSNPVKATLAIAAAAAGAAALISLVRAHRSASCEADEQGDADRRPDSQESVTADDSPVPPVVT